VLRLGVWELGIGFEAFGVQGLGFGFCLLRHEVGSHFGFRASCFVFRVSGKYHSVEFEGFVPPQILCLFLARA